FWNTANSKTVNSVKQIHAIVDGKAVVISESSVRSDVLFNDEDGIACLTNDEIFENLALMGYEQLSTIFKKLKDLSEPFNDTYETPTHSKKVFSNMARKSKKFSRKVTPLFDSMLVQNQAPEGKVSHELQTEAHIEQILPSPSTYQRKQRKTQKHRRAKQVTVLPQTSVPLDHGADEAVHKEGVTVWQSQAPRNHGGALAQTRSERVLEKPNEPPLPEGHTSGSGEGSMEHTFELMDTVPPTPHDSPLSGGYTPGSDEGRMTLDELITLCTKLWEDASKQGRRSDKLKPMFKDTDFEELDDHMENVEEETFDAAATEVSTVSALVSTDGVTISTAEPRTPPTTTIVFDDEDVTIAMAQTLIKMKEQKAKEKGVAITNVEDSSRIVRPVRLITTLQPLPTIDPKDKGKSVLVEEEPVKIKMRDQGDLQVQADAELAQRIHEDELAELEIAQQERQRQEDATNAALAKEFDEIQARIDVDHEMDRKQDSVKSVEEAACKNYEHEREELRMWLTVVSDEKGLWIQDFTAKLTYSWIGNLRNLRGFGRFAQIGLKRFEDATPEGYNLLLWGDLKVICGVHTLLMDGTLTSFNMLVEKRYPLIKEMLQKMLNWKLEAEAESTMAFELLKFIKSQLEE
ncbi:hypothetical protein Tco_0432255, partial [Tanacetum coccineum]